MVVSSAGANSVTVLLQGASAPAMLSVQSGSPQTTPVGATYGAPLAALVRDVVNHPLPGVAVTFAAPAGGASGLFSGSRSVVQATSDPSGVATSPAFTANSVAGTFNVVASVGALNATFALTNATTGQAPAFTSTPPPNGTAYVAYSFNVTASGAPTPTYVATPNALPTGLSINGTSGLITGTPNAAGTFAGMLTASNGTHPDATQTFAISIALAAQTITFNDLSDKALGAAPFTVAATSTSGLAVGFLSLTGGVCTVSGNTVTLIATGTCTIQATQGGNVNYGAAAAINQSFHVTAAVSDTVWFEDAVPAGSIVAADGGDAWQWTASNPTPYAGSLAHQSVAAGGEHQHYFYDASTTLSVAAGDTLFAYVYLDPANPPSEIMLQWNDGGWEHRAYWGSNSIAWGTDGTEARHFVAALPAAAQWTRLEVAASTLGLEGRTLNGMAFTLNGGRATWDHAGKASMAARLSQTISFAALLDRALGAAPFALSATSSSGLPVSFMSRTPTICSVSAGTVTLVAPGRCLIRATQAGDAIHAPALYVEQGFNITASTQTITLLPLISPPAESDCPRAINTR